MKILIIQNKMIGDVLTSSILFETLRKTYPEATLDYLVSSHTTPVIENNPFIDHVILFSKTEQESQKALFNLAKRIALNKYNIVIDVYSKISSNILTYYSKADKKISYKKWYTKWIYTNNIKRINATFGVKDLAIKNRLSLLKPLGINEEKAIPKIYLTSEEINTGKSLLESYNIDFNVPIYMISILGSSKNKTYPFKSMATLLECIVAETNGQLLFNYTSNQIEDVKLVYNLCNRATKNRIYLDLFGKSLRDFFGLTHHCTALIGNEGGAINMAKALNTPTFSIFSPWIDKATWSLFENNQNVSVHLNDFKPELFKNKTIKDLKKDEQKLYKNFNPEDIKPVLTQFLTTFN